MKTRLPTDTKRVSLCDHLVNLLEYPMGDYIDAVRDSVTALSKWRISLEQSLAPFIEHVESHALEELEEAYTRVFDVSPDCALEIGWHLYGENYSRGAFLVEMRGRMRSLGIAETAELPDHLTHVLAVIGRLSEEDARGLARDQLLPALKKMRASLPETRPHACVLATVEYVIRELLSITEDLATGKEASPYFRELPVLPPGCPSETGRTL